MKVAKYVEPIGYTKAELARAWRKREEYGASLIESGELGIVFLGDTEFIPKFEVERYLRSKLMYKREKNMR